MLAERIKEHEEENGDEVGMEDETTARVVKQTSEGRCFFRRVL